MRKTYHRPHAWNWFLQRPGYVRFMVRELTAVFVGVYLVSLLIFLKKLGAGQEAFTEFLKVLKSSPAMIFHLVALVAAIWHSITWFNLTPTALPVFIGEKRLADPLVAWGLGYVPWIVISLLIFWGIGP